MAGVQDYVERLRRGLLLAEPDLDTTIGTTARKIIDVVAEVEAENDTDRYLLDYQYDIDTKSGGDLEDFCRLFGFSRLPARRATGTIVMERSSPATQNILIGVGTQVASDTIPSVVYATVVPVVMLIGSMSVQVPVQAITGGSAGNVSAGSVERFVNPVPGISSFSNPTAMIGGTDAESDGALRERFKRTIFRNLAGTESMFLGVALDNDAVSKANVVGSHKHRVEQIEVVGGAAVSTVQDAKYVYADSAVFGRDIRGGDILIEGLHFTFTPNIQPQILITDPLVPDGIYELEFDYVPIASRNDPSNGITNRIDVFVNGRSVQSGIETRLFSPDNVFGEPGLVVADFRRVDATQPVAGNIFIPLSQAPVVDASLDNAITVGATTYYEGIDYFLVNNITNVGGARQSLSGLEWLVPANGGLKAVPATGESVTISYAFNSVPREVEVALRNWRLVCTDVWVHQAKTILLNIHLAIILEPGFTVGGVRPTLEYDLRNLLDAVGFNGVLQVSDIIQTAHNVAGIDAVRLLNSNDHGTNYAIQEVSEAGTVLKTHATVGLTPNRAVDVLTGDDEIVALNQVFITVKAQNSFGAA